jgi:hypothetical protein
MTILSFLSDHSIDHVQKLLVDFAPTRFDSLCNAALEIVVHHELARSAQSFLRRRDLLEDLSAGAIGFEHPLNPVNLSTCPLQTSADLELSLVGDENVIDDG